MNSEMFSILEFLWYSTFMHIVASVFAYYYNGTVQNTDLFIFTVPIGAFIIYIAQGHIKRGWKQMKESFNEDVE